jgi:hypothetical protein
MWTRRTSGAGSAASALSRYRGFGGAERSLSRQVYSEDQQRWLHCDPCEDAWDAPLLYSEARRGGVGGGVGRGGVAPVILPAFIQHTPHPWRPRRVDEYTHANNIAGSQVLKGVCVRMDGSVLPVFIRQPTPLAGPPRVDRPASTRPRAVRRSRGSAPACAADQISRARRHSHTRECAESVNQGSAPASAPAQVSRSRREKNRR